MEGFTHSRVRKPSLTLRRESFTMEYVNEKQTYIPIHKYSANEGRNHQFQTREKDEMQSPVLGNGEERKSLIPFGKKSQDCKVT